MANAAPFALESNASWVIRSRWRGVEGRATLRVGVVVVVLHNTTSTISHSRSPHSSSSSTKDSLHSQLTYRVVTCAVIVPPCGRVNYSCWVDIAHYIHKGNLRIRRTRELSPSFVIDDLRIFVSACIKDTVFNRREKTNPSHNGWIILMLVDKNLELALELCLLGRIGWSTAICHKTGHILDDHQAQFVTSPVE